MISQKNFNNKKKSNSIKSFKKFNSKSKDLKKYINSSNSSSSRSSSKQKFQKFQLIQPIQSIHQVNSSNSKDDQGWISESSTKSNQFKKKSNSSRNSSTNSLNLKLPNPIPTSISTSASNLNHNHNHNQNQNQNQNQNHNHNHSDSIDRGRSKTRNQNHHHQNHNQNQSPNQNQNQNQSSNQSPSHSSSTTTKTLSNFNLNQAKLKTTNQLPSRFINRSSIHSLTSLINFNSDLNPINHQLKRVESVSSVVLPPKIDTTKAIIDLKKNHSNPLNKSQFANRLREFSNTIDFKLANQNHQSQNLMSSILSPRIPLKSKKLITTPTTNSSHSGSASGSGSANGSGYFESFRNLVGMTQLNLDQINSNHQKDSIQIHSTKKINQINPSSHSSILNQNSNHNRLNSILSDSINQNQNQNHQTFTFSNNHSFNPSPNIKSLDTKPLLAGFITTCGPVPVISKFIGPKSILPSDHLSKPQTSIMGGNKMAKPQPLNLQHPSSIKPNSIITTSSTTTTSSTSSSPSSASSSSSSPSSSSQNHSIQQKTQKFTSDSNSLTRIQKKLLLERDRPISPPNLLVEQASNSNDSSHQLQNQINNQFNSSSTTLPPPSYLIRSLGGQTGPLPLMPLNLPSINWNNPSKSFISSKPNSNPPSRSDSITRLSTTPPSITPNLVGQLNQPALRAKQALCMKLWRNSLIDEVEQVLTDHESNVRWRDPLIESLSRVVKQKAKLKSKQLNLIHHPNPFDHKNLLNLS